jgi:trimethylamine-N-oxide reductase cytochrome c-type subunit TorC
MLRRLWRWLRWPSVTIPAGALLAVGGIGGVVFWGGFNTAMEYTNRMEFCIACHEMRDNVYAEYKQTIHYSNTSGVRAICSDCHVPKEWVPKVIRKVQATNELWHWAIGSIDTKDKYEAKRLELARHVWATMERNDSHECRNCHGFEAMDFHAQRPKAAEAMRKAMAEGGTCIDCHKGIAHKLPDMTAGYRAMFRALLARAAEDARTATRLVSLRTKPIFAEADDVRPGGGPHGRGRGQDRAAGQGQGRPDRHGDGPADGRLLPGTVVEVVERRDGRLKVRIEGWQQEQAFRVIYQRMGQRIFAAALQPGLVDRVERGEATIDPASDLAWYPARLEAWTAPDDLSADEPGVWAYGAELFQASCTTCHAKPAPETHLANQWIGTLKAMARFISLEKDEYALLQTWLQRNAKDGGDHVGGS